MVDIKSWIFLKSPRSGTTELDPKEGRKTADFSDLLMQKAYWVQAGRQVTDDQKQKYKAMKPKKQNGGTDRETKDLC